MTAKYMAYTCGHPPGVTGQPSTLETTLEWSREEESNIQLSRADKRRVDYTLATLQHLIKE